MNNLNLTSFGQDNPSEKKTFFLGFSFCDRDKNWECLPENQEEMTQDLYSGLVQFFQLFPEFRLNPFYIFGESYGAKYSIFIAKKISDENLRIRQLHVRL